MSGIIDDILGNLNYVDRIEGLIMSLRHGDYNEARKHGLPGVAAEVVSSLVMANTHSFAMSRSGNHTLNEVEALLARYGIPIFGRTHDARCMYFHVKKRQARWAEYLLLQAGVQLESPTFDSRNAAYPARHAPGWMPKPWGENAPPDKPVASPTMPPSEMNRLGERSSGIDSFLDKLEKHLFAEKATTRTPGAAPNTPSLSATTNRARRPDDWPGQIETMLGNALRRK